MNIGIFTGKLIDGAEILTFEQEGDEPRVAVYFVIKVKNRNNKREPYIVECISFLREHRLDIVVEKLVKEQMVTVTGDVSIRQFEEDDGFVYSRFALELSNMDIHYLPKDKHFGHIRNANSVLSRLESDEDLESISPAKQQTLTVTDRLANDDVQTMDIAEAQRMAALFQDDDGVGEDNGLGF